MNRLRAKIDKEIENKDIKKKLRNVQAKVHTNLLYNQNQTNLEKSGILTGKSSARRSGGARSNSLLIHSERQVSPQSSRMTARKPTISNDVTSNAYLKTIKPYALHQQLQQQQQQQQHQQQKQPPLGMYMTTSFNQKPRLNNRQKKAKSKTTSILPAISDNEPSEGGDKSSRSSKSFHRYDDLNSRNEDSLSCTSSDVQSRPSSSRLPVPDVHIKKSFFACDSARSLDCMTALTAPFMDVASLSSGSSTYLNLDLDMCSLDLSSRKSSDDIFHMAPLIPAPSATLSSSSSARPQIDSSATLIRKFRYVLEREARSMPEDDIKVVKDVLKTDKRVNLLKAKEPDSNLFKDILKTQLDEIVRSEKVVTNALCMLGAAPQQVIEMSKPIEVYNVAPIYAETADNRKSSSSPGKGKKLKHCSSESSPRAYASYECARSQQGTSRRRNVATSTMSIKDGTPRNEILNDNTENNKSMKNVKLVKENVAPADEFEAFIKSTLPFKRKAPSQNQTGKQVLHRQQTHPDDMHSKKSRGSGETHSNLSSMKESRRPQVDVTFKNVPSVEKEILILKALGKRLEETLKRSVSEPSLSDRGGKNEVFHCCSSTSSLTRELKRIDDSIQVFPGRRSGSASVKNLSIVMNVLALNVNPRGLLIFSQGVRLEIGIVNEYVIVSKTVNELLSEPAGEFYIANKTMSGTLNPILFQQVAEQPQVLMHYLKPKNPAKPFNLLDQDSNFFNSFLLPGLKSKIPVKSEKTDAGAIAEIDIGSKEKPKLVLQEIKEEKPKLAICEGGDSLMIAREGIPPLMMEPCCSKFTMDKPIVPFRSRSKKRAVPAKSPAAELSVSTTASQRTVQRARMRRIVTPMPCDAFDDPKNNLIKTILVGAVQVSIFLVMIMAITYPDVKC